ncbi:hypothetical protein CRUP_026781 [Coryphaenoides rupestris]|nr:hypothetical protein CRUP_026781 [Coryphaenoides rupestris]
MASLQECQAEVTRENRQLAGVGSERLVKEHRGFFRDKGPQSVCEKRLQLMEELCEKLPAADPAQRSLEAARRALADVQEEVDATHQKLMQHQDKWKEYAARLLRNRANDPSKYGHVKTTITELRQDAELQEGNLGWLRTRMAALIEVCSDSDGQRHGGALGKLSVDFKGLLASLMEAEKMVLAVGDCVQFREEVRATLEEVVDGQKEAQVEALRILDSPTVRDAQQLLLGRQQLLKRLKQRRRDVQQLTTRGQQLQAEEGLVTLAAWQEFDSQQEAVREFVFLKQCEAEVTHMSTLLRRATEIQLGPRNKALLLDQARSLGQQVAQTLEGMRAQWDQFGRGFEAFSAWISDKEKQLDPLKSSSAPLEEQIATVKVPQPPQASQQITLQNPNGPKVSSLDECRMIKY